MLGRVFCNPNFITPTIKNKVKIMNEKIKKLISKNKQDYEPAAKALVDEGDELLFKELVEQDSFLFDFVKNNVAQRLFNACNENNYRNLLKFFQYYSPSYDDAIVSALARFADEDLTDEILELFENGSESQKCYCAKFFSFVQDPLAIDMLRANSYTENDSLNANCAATLGILHDEESFNKAIEKLKSEDEFEKLSAVKFLVIYGDKAALPNILDTMKNSSMSENIAGFIPYIINLQELINTDYENGLLVLSNIINGLGEILGLYEVIDFELYNIFEDLISQPITSASAVILLQAQDKFALLTENDEYMYDEDKNTQAEIKDIKKLLGGINKKKLKTLIDSEIRENGRFVFTALDYTDNEDLVRELLRGKNQTLILKTLEVLKRMGVLDSTAKTVALLKVTDENIKSIIRAL